MKKIYISFALMLGMAAAGGTVNAQECLTSGACTVSTSQYPMATQTTTSTSFTAIAIDMYAGEFAVCNVTAGVTYQWSLCAADGGDAPYDSQLSLYNGTTNAPICHSDDVCGDDAKIGWTATYTGTVKIQVNEYNCLSNTDFTTLVWRTAPATGPDAAVGNIYTMGTISSVHSNPHVVTARINNSGSTTLTSLPVTLTVSGANTFTNTQTIASLAPGATQIVTFAGYNSPSTGTNTVTVSVPADNVAGNNTMAVSQTVNTNSESYAYGSVASGGVGYPTGQIELAAKFYATGPSTLSSVIVPFQIAGSVYKVKVYNAGGTGGAPGTLIYTSPNQTSAIGPNTVTFSPNVAVPASFFIGIEQVSTTSNMSLSYQTETPIRPQTFYLTLTPASPVWADFSPNNAFRLMIEPVFACTAPAVPAAITGPAAICGTAPVTYSVAPVAGATSYTWTLPGGWSGTSTTSSISATPGTTGGNITVTATNSCGTSTAQTLAVTTTSGAPAQPGAITGAATACSGAAGTYSVTPVAGASSYTWTLPSGWSGTSSTNTISATAGTTGGNITVTAANGCGTSTAQTLAVTVESAPATPGTVTGNTTICSGTTNTYSVPAVTGATSYSWTMPSGWTGTSTSNSINATAGTTGGPISVTAINNCGTSVSGNLTVNVTATPGQPTAITGAVSVCDGATATYTVPAVTGATSYNWTLPTGWTGTSTTNSLTATAGSGSGNITVTATNSCGTSTAQTLAVTATGGAPAQPAAITGGATVCPGANETYTVAPVTGASSYTWTLPSGWSGTSSTNSINTVAGTAGGTISVVASNGCGSSPAQTVTVTVSGLAQPAAITGDAAVCSGATATYTVPAVTGATTYSWTLPGGWSGTSATNSITATAGTTGGTISVTATNGTCTSAAQTTTVTVNPLPATPTITATGNVLSSSAAAGNVWSLNGTVIANQTGQSLTATSDGVYTVTVTNASNCSATSAPYNHTMVGIADGLAGVKLNIYPNPASAYVIIAADGADEDMIVEVSTIVGVSVIKAVAPSVNGKIEYTLKTGSLSKGVYMVSVSSKQGISTSRLVIQ